MSGPIDLDSLAQDLKGPGPKKPVAGGLDLDAIGADLAGMGAAPVSTLPTLPPHGIPPTNAGRFPEFAEPPRYSPFGDPLNPAAHEEEAESFGTRLIQAEPRGTPIKTIRTAALGEALGVGHTILGLPAMAEHFLEFAGLGEEPNNIPAPKAPPGAAPAETPGSAFFRDINPAPMVQALTEMRDPEAVGGALAGLGMMGAGAAKGAPGTELARAAVVDPEAAQAFYHLGLDPATATEADVMAAFRERAKRSHPDVAPDERAARGGSADPLVAAQEYADADNARQVALAALGRAKPAPGPTGEPEAPPAQPMGTEEAFYRAQEAQAPPPVTPEPEAAPLAVADREEGISAATAAKARERGEQVGFAPGSEGRGLEVTGQAPPEPTGTPKPTLAEMSGAATWVSKPPVLPTPQHFPSPPVAPASPGFRPENQSPEEAFESGRTAFTLGIRRIPPGDLQGTAAKAWLKGWDQENIAAPEPEIPKPDATSVSATPEAASEENVPHGTIEAEGEPAAGGALPAAAPGEPGGEPAGPGGRPETGEAVAGTPGERGAGGGPGTPAERAEPEEERPLQPDEAREQSAVPEQLGRSGAGTRAPRPRPRPVEGGSGLVGERGPGRGADYRIGPTDRLGVGGLAAKARDNVAAVRLLKTLGAEGRQATPDEQAQLVKYVGWGGIPQAFNVSHPEWGETARELRGLLTQDEWDAARASTPNAHYTSETVIRGIYDALDRMGFRGGRLLEPSAGVGHFLGLTPDHLPAQWTAVELDPTTAAILKHLYPSADVRVGGFEAQRLADDHYAGGITNVPFGNYPVHDPLYNAQKWPIHNYFPVKMLDKVHPGGVVAVITSSYAMDAKGHAAWRDYVRDRADLLGALRLPNTAFKGNAGTEVTTDLLFLRKRLVGQTEAGGEAWGKVAATPDGIPVNEYYAAHPEMMLGTMARIRGMYAEDEPTLNPHPGEQLADALADAIQKLPEGALALNSPQPTDQSTGRRPGGKAQGGYAIEDGKLVQILADDSRVPVEGTKAPQIKAMVQIAQAARAVLQSQAEDLPEREQTSRRAALNTAYDRFAKKYGPLGKTVKSGTGTRRPNLEVFQADPDVSLLASLEDVDEERDVLQKAAIFTRRVIDKQPPLTPETPHDALLAVLNERGKVDLDRMAELLGQDAAGLREQLHGLVYEDPSTGNLETADNYLSGNVRAKLVVAKEAAAKDSRFGENARALEAVQPEDVPPSQIAASLGAPWIGPDDITAFIEKTLGKSQYRQATKVAYLAAEAAWTVHAPYDVAESVTARKEWGTERAPAISLIQDALNQVASTVYDPGAEPGSRVINEKETLAAREMQQKIKDRFAQWVWEEEPRATRLHRYYNDTFNNYRPARYDGSHLTLPGSSSAIKLLPHQKDAIWRGLQQRKLGLFQVVGAGKTYEMAAIAMEAKRLGLTHKAMHVVPNHLVGQFQRDFLKLYPAARILVADDKSFAKAGAAARKEFTARVATGNWDSVVITHSSFSRIPMSQEFEQGFIQDQLAQYEDAQEEARQTRNRDLTKLIEKGKKRLQARLKQVENREAKDDLLPFEQLGIDHVFADEAQAYKNLYFMTKMRNVPGAGQLTQRSMDMYLKSRYLDQHGGRLVLATGTPIANTISEMYTMQRYLQPELLRERGIEHFDAWAAAFGEARTALELAPSGGGYRMNTRFAYFKNVGELAQLFRAMADVKTAEDLKLPVPKLRGEKPAPVVVPSTPELKQYIDQLVERAAAIKGRQVDPRTDNMLKVTHDGRFAALDMRLIDPTLPVSPTTKVTAVADKVHAIWKANTAERATQLVFINGMKPRSPNVKFDVYSALRQELLDRGVPPEEVAFIHDADSDAKKEVLFRKVREGRVRVMMGSIDKMGMGTNVQDRLLALHHVNAPWRPADIEQGDGRILRRGNRNPEVQIYHYVTEGSFDSYIWQMLERKARSIDQMMKAQASTRTIEDVDGRALTFAEIKAISTGNPLVMEKATVDAEVQRLSRLAAAHRDRQFAITQDLLMLPERVAAATATVAAMGQDAAKIEDRTGDQFQVTLGKETIADRKTAGERLVALGQKLTAGPAQLIRLGKFAGLDLLLDTNVRPVKLTLQGESTYSTSLPETPDGAVKALEYLPKRVALDQQNLKDRIASMETQRADLERLRDEPFPQGQKLAELAKRQEALNKQLDLDKPEGNEVAEEADIPDVGTPEAADGPEPVDVEDALAKAAGTPPDTDPEPMTPAMNRQIRERLVTQLGLSHAEAEGLEDRDLARRALKEGVFDDLTERDLLEDVRRWAGPGDDPRAGFLRMHAEDAEAATQAVADAEESGSPRVLVERAPQGLGFISNYLLPPSWAMQRLMDAKNPITARAAATALRIVHAGQNATLAMARYADEREGRRNAVNGRLTDAQKAQVRDLLDTHADATTLPAGTPAVVRAAFEEKRAGFVRDKRLMGQVDRSLLRGRSKAIVDAALEEWPEGTPSPDFDQTPVNRRRLLEVADQAQIPATPVTRADWDALYARLRDEGFRVAQPAYMESPDLRRIYQYIRGEGGIGAYLPHVFKGDWVVRAGPNTARFVDRFDAIEHARQLIENGTVTTDIHVVRDGYVPDWGTYLSRTRWVALKEQLARDLDAESAVVSKALGENQILVQPRKRFFAHGQQRLVNLQTFEQDLDKIEQTYNWRLARYLAFTPFRKVALDLAEGLPADGGWRDWSEAHIAGVQGVPDEITSSLNNSLTHLLRGHGGPIPLQMTAGLWQRFVSFWLGGYNPVWPLLHTLQYMTNVPSAFPENGHYWAARGLKELVAGSPESKAAIDAAGIRFQHPLYAVSEFLPRGVGGKGESWWHPMWMFNKALDTMRAATALAKYYEQRAAGRTVGDAQTAATQFVRDTYFDFSMANAPRAMRNPVGRTMGQLQLYGLNQLMFADNLFRKGNWRQRAAFSFQTMAWYGAAGLMALWPLFALNWLLGKTGAFRDKDGRHDTPWGALWDHLGPADATKTLAFFKYGVLGLFGVNLSEHVGLMGPSGWRMPVPISMLRTAADALTAPDPRQQEAAAKRLLPVAVQRLMRAIETAHEGKIRNTAGHIVQDSVTNADVARQALGLQSVHQAERSEAQTRAREEVDAFKAARTHWLDQAAKAYRRGGWQEAASTLDDARREGVYLTGKDIIGAVKRSEESPEARAERTTPKALRPRLGLPSAPPKRARVP